MGPLAEPHSRRWPSFAHLPNLVLGGERLAGQGCLFNLSPSLGGDVLCRQPGSITPPRLPACLPALGRHWLGIQGSL